MNIMKIILIIYIIIILKKKQFMKLNFGIILNYYKKMGLNKNLENKLNLEIYFVKAVFL